MKFFCACPFRVIIGLNNSAGTGLELLAPVSLIAGASRFVRQDVYRSRLPRSIGNRDQCASLVSLTLACAAESKSTPIVVSLSGSTGTRSKRNFHRPESNWGIALNSSCRAFIVFQSQLRLRIQSPRQSAGSVPQTRKKCSNLSFQESDFSSCHFLKRSKIGISQNVKSLPRGAEFFLSWRRFFAGPVRHRTDSPLRAVALSKPEAWRIWTSRRVTTDCHLLQSSDRSHLAILLFADMATPNAHRHLPPPRLTALLVLLWFA